MKAGDYINRLVQESLNSLIPEKMETKDKYLLRLYIFQKENDRWIALCDEPSNEIAKISEWVNQIEDEEWYEPLKEYEETMIYGVMQENVADHRMRSDRVPKSLLWAIHMEKKDESLNILSNVILNELIPKYSDMLILEDMKSLYEGGMSRGVNKRNFFFGNISNKNKLLNKYMEQVRKNEDLPEFQLLCHLSSMNYETRQNRTMLCFSAGKEPMDIQFDDKSLEFKNVEHLRAIRKVMEISGPKGAVCVKMPEMTITGVMQMKQVDGVTVEFKGNAEWILRKSNQDILLYRKGEYLIPVFALKYSQETEKLEQLEGCLAKDDLVKIRRVINRLRDNNSHGTSIVFMQGEALENEIKERFANYGYAIKVKEFDLERNEMLCGITAIDGAILADLQGKCRAIGTILDGEFVSSGNKGRGARYNSVKNYVQWYKMKHPDVICFAVIFSEDGMLNVEIPMHGESEAE